MARSTNRSGVGADDRHLIQRQPLPGEAPTERTEVTLLRDEDNLYIGVRAFDSEADRVIGTQMARDASLSADDRIELLLDTFSDRRSAFYFATNPAGALVDGLAFANGQLNLEWDAIWRVRTSRNADGWSAEFAIPFKSLGFPAGQDVWGFNVSRTIYRKLEDNRWSGAQLQTQFLQVSEAGQITNLGQLTQGIGLDVRPFLAGSWLNLRTEGTTGIASQGSMPSTTSRPASRPTATFNTDFGETEVDARQINLTRFSLLFPEKRAFFLEGAGVFSFASTGPETPGGIPATGADVFPFFSRQIGLLGGQEVPIDAGIKLIGTAGRTEVGVLDVRTGDLRVDDQLVTDEKNFFIGRVKRNLFRQSYVGAHRHRRAIRPKGQGRTYGADLRLATSRFLGAQRNLVVNAYAARSDNEVRPRDDWSYGFSAHYPNDKYLAQFVVREIQENFQPALGFVQRDNVRMLRAAASYNPRPRNLLNIQQMNHDVFYTQFTRLDLNEVESWDVYVTWWDWHFNSGDNLHGILDFNPTYERLFEPFEISPGVVLNAGRIPLHPIQDQSVLERLEAPPLWQRERHVGELLVGRGGAVDDLGDVQSAAAIYVQPEHESDVCPTARRPFHGEDLHLEYQLRGLAMAVVLEPRSVRQPLEQPRLAEPRPMDVAAGQRPVRGVQPGLDP